MQIFIKRKGILSCTEKYFDELNERLNQLEENTNFPAEDIITAQRQLLRLQFPEVKKMQMLL